MINFSRTSLICSYDHQKVMNFLLCFLWNLSQKLFLHQVVAKVKATAFMDAERRASGLHTGRETEGQKSFMTAYQKECV